MVNIPIILLVIKKLKFVLLQQGYEVMDFKVQAFRLKHVGTDEKDPFPLKTLMP